MRMVGKCESAVVNETDIVEDAEIYDGGLLFSHAKAEKVVIRRVRASCGGLMDGQKKSDEKFENDSCCDRDRKKHEIIICGPFH
jgi:hypothetical protein